MTARTPHDARPAGTGALTLRLGLGAVMLAHALAKPLLFTFPGTVQFFEGHGLPGWTAYPVFAAELAGGALLLLGLAVRPVALALIPVMLGAAAVHVANGWLFLNPGGGWEYPAFLVVALAAQAQLGAGAYAVRVPQPRPTAASFAASR